MSLPNLLLTIAFSATLSNEINVGRTWPIAEPNPIKLATERANALNKDSIKPISSYREKLSAKLINRTQVNLVRRFTPSYTTPRDIYDRNGQVLYPKGYTFNPIEYMPVHKSRIIVVDEQDIDVVMEHLRPTDIVILHHGSLSIAAQKLARRVDMLDLLTAESLNIKHIPVSITIDYETKSYRLAEFNPELGVEL